MTFLNFPASDVYGLLSDGLTWTNSGTKALSINVDTIESVQYPSVDSGTPAAKIVYSSGYSYLSANISVNSTVLAELDTNPDFLVIEGSSRFIQTFDANWTLGSNKLVINRNKIISASPTSDFSAANGLSVWRITYVDYGTISQVYVTGSVANSVSSSPKETGESSLMFTRDELGQNTITHVNNITGAIGETIQTGLLAGAGWTWFEYRTIVQNGGFAVMYRNNDNGDRKLYFIDNKGTVVDEYYTTYYINREALNGRAYIAAIEDNDNNWTVKTFDGTTVHTHQFNDVMIFDWGSYNDGAFKDGTIPLYIVFNSGDLKFYLARPSGELVDATNVFFSGEQVYFMATNTANYGIVWYYSNDTGYYTSMKAISMEGTELASIDLSGLKIDGYDTYTFMSDGVYHSQFYSDDNETWTQIGYDPSTNSFYKSSETSWNDYDDYNDNSVNADLYSAYPSLRNVAIVQHYSYVTGWDPIYPFEEYSACKYTWISAGSGGYQELVLAAPGDDNVYATSPQINTNVNMLVGEAPTVLWTNGQSGLDGVINYAVLSASGVTQGTLDNIETINGGTFDITYDNIDNIMCWDCGDATVIKFDIDSTTDRCWVVFDKDGIVGAWQTSSSWSFDYQEDASPSSGNTFFVVDDTNWEGTFIWNKGAGFQGGASYSEFFEPVNDISYLRVGRVSDDYWNDARYSTLSYVQPNATIIVYFNSSDNVTGFRTWTPERGFSSYLDIYAMGFAGGWEFYDAIYPGEYAFSFAGNDGSNRILMKISLDTCQVLSVANAGTNYDDWYEAGDRMLWYDNDGTNNNWVFLTNNGAKTLSTYNDTGYPGGLRVAHNDWYWVD